MVNILYICSDGVNYLEDFIYRGFCDIEYVNIHDYPIKKIFHSEISKEKLNSYNTVVLTPNNVEELIKESYYDFIIIGSYRNEMVSNNIINICKKINKKVHLLNGEDHPHLHAYEKISGIYFLREYKNNSSYYKNIVPLQFGYPVSLLPKIQDRNKTQDIFFRGCRTNILREKILSFLSIDIDKTISYDEYILEMSKSKICLSLRGAGFDTVRYWEIPASGNLLMSEIPDIKIPNDFVDGVSCIRFNEGNILDKIEYYLKNEDICKEISNNGYNHFLKFHSSKKRAEYVLNVISDYERI